MVEGIPAAVPHCYPGFLRALMDLLHQLLAAILRQLGQHEADDLAVIGWIDAQVRLLDGFLDRTEHAAVPRLDQHHAGIGSADIGHAIDRRRRAVVVHLDSIEQSWTSPTGADRLEVSAQDL